MSSDRFKVTEHDLDVFMRAALELVEQAGELVKDSIHHAKGLATKSAGVKEGHSSAILTETDKEVEQLLISGLKSQFSDHHFIGEESVGGLDQPVTDYPNNPTWILDPIDGTMNFFHGNPLVAISVGLAINRRMVLAIVSSPLIGHIYTAIKGKGAFLNANLRLQVSGVEHLADAMVLMELPTGASADKRDVAVANVSVLLEKAHAIRCPGPAALDLAWVGSGSADAFFHSAIHCWDMAAGALIITEAGGVVRSATGGEFDLMGRGIIAASSLSLANELAQAVRSVDVPRDFDDACPI